MGAHYERLLANKGANGMGDKKPKKLKVDHIKDINNILSAEVPGLNKCTIDTLEHLYVAIQNIVEE